MSEAFEGIVDRFLLASNEFERTLRAVRPGQWASPTPCTEWTVRQLVNHMAGGCLNYVKLARGGTGEEFLRLRDSDVLGTDPVGAYRRSFRLCAEAFGEPGALDRILDYPLGKVTGRQALAMRTTDSAIHAWDLKRAIGADERIDPGLVSWIGSHLDEIYAGLPESPVDPDSTHRFFAASPAAPDGDVSRQERLLRRMGRTP